MQTLIKTHNLHQTYEGNYFFILSKGNNAGKPLDKPCPNCFVVITDSPSEKEILYWICYGLWHGGCFRPFLIGSVIPFLRLSELKPFLKEIRIKTQFRSRELIKTIDTLNKLLIYQHNIHQQLELIRQAKRSLMHTLIR